MITVSVALDILNNFITPILIALVGLFQYKTNLLSKERYKQQEQREALRQKGCLLQLRLTDVTKDLSMITAKKMMEQKTNGEVERAFEKMTIVEAEYDDYLREVTRLV